MLTLAQITSAVSFLAMVVSLWLGCYIVTRSPRSRLAWLAGITLWALTGFFVDVLISTNPAPITDGWQGWPICFSLVLWYHLSLNMLPPDRGRRQRRFLIFAYAQAIVIDLLLATTSLLVADAKQTLGANFKVLTLGPLFLLLPISTLSVTLFTLDNFWTTRQAAPNPSLRNQLNSPVRGSLLALLAVAYTVLALGLRVPAPTWPMVVLLALGVASLGYGVVRYSALVDGRVVRYDFAINGLLILLVTALYFAVAWLFHLRFDLPIIAVIVIVILVVVTHAGFDFAQRWLDWPYLRRPERALRTALHNTVGDLNERKSAEDGLRGALAAVVAGVEAEWGVIALRAENDFTVRASYHGKSVGERLPADQITARELTILPTTDQADPAVIAPFMVEGACTGAILLGQPKNAAAYSQDDLDLVAEAADRLAELSLRFQQQAAHASEIDKMLHEFQTRERELQQEVAALRTPAKQETVSPEVVTQVEDALRRLHDYAYLGEHALGARVLPRDQTGIHLDRGKALNALLIATIEKLRPPAAVEPRELPAREWHPYLILRDAYVRGEANRDIMARLYVSEATFHRTRRSALRAVAQTLLELDHSTI